jgi:hypothetical protein
MIERDEPPPSELERRGDVENVEGATAEPCPGP